MPYTNKSLTVLRHSIINSIHDAILNTISQPPQFRNDEFQIPFMPSKNVGNILKEKHTWTNTSDSINENRETIACIVNPHLITKPAKWLAWRTANNYVYIVRFWVFKSNFQKLVIAMALQIPIICFNGRLRHFITDGTEACCLKSK